MYTIPLSHLILKVLTVTNLNDLETNTVHVGQERYPLYITYKKGIDLQTIHNMILHFHGFPGRPKEEFSDIHKFFSAKDFMIANFNYPGLWGAPGLFVPEEVMECCVSIVEFLQNYYPNKNLFVYARSFGGMVALATALRILRKKGELLFHAIAFQAPAPKFNLKVADGLFQAMAFQAPGPKFNPKFADGVAWRRLTIADIIGLMQESEEWRKILRTEKEKWVLDEVVAEFDVPSILKVLDDITEKQGKPIPKLVVVGKNDGILSTEEIVATYRDHAQIVEYSNLTHIYIPDPIYAAMVETIVAFYLKNQ
jgi:pimeloyl-ACP methyl ester carboxylesterase